MSTVIYSQVRLEGTFQVQYKLSSIDKICGIMSITTESNFDLSFGFIKKADDCGSVPNALVCNILLGVLLLNKNLLCNIQKVNSTQPRLSIPFILKTITAFGKSSGFKVQLIGLKDVSVIHSSPFKFSMVKK